MPAATPICRRLQTAFIYKESKRDSTDRIIMRVSRAFPEKAGISHLYTYTYALHTKISICIHIRMLDRWQQEAHTRGHIIARKKKKK